MFRIFGKSEPKLKSSIFCGAAVWIESPTLVNLKQRGLMEEAICKRCGSAAESIEHILLECPMAMKVWKQSPLRLEIRPSLEREWCLAEDEEIIMLQAEVDVLTPKLETLKTNLDEIKKKRAQHIRDYQVGVVEMEIKKAFLCATMDDPAIAKVDEEIIMLQAEVDPLAAKLEILTTKLDELKEKRAQHIKNYQVGVLEVEIKKTSTSTSAIAKADKEIIMLQANVDALKATVTTKADHLKTRREQHIEGIPSFGTKLSLEVVEEDSSVKSEEDQKSDGTFTYLVEQDKAIEALKKKRAQLDKEKEALKKKGAQLDKEIEVVEDKRARFISSLVRK